MRVTIRRAPGLANHITPAPTAPSAARHATTTVSTQFIRDKDSDIVVLAQFLKEML